MNTSKSVEAASSRLDKSASVSSRSLTNGNDPPEPKRQDAASTLVEAASSRLDKSASVSSRSLANGNDFPEPKRQDAASTLVEAASSRLDKSASASSRSIECQPAQSELLRQDAAATLLQYFDPREPIADLSGNLPHWRQEGVTYFVTFRLADSLPQEKLRRWATEREAWIKANPEPHAPAQLAEYNRLFTARFHYWLDHGYGSCALRRPEVKDIMENALRHFAGQRYALDEFVVMPNHVHALVSPLHGHELSAILHSWKSFTANQINRLLNTSGTLWQKESFDHIVRSPGSMENLRRYIRENPVAAAIEAASRVEAASSRFDKSASVSSRSLTNGNDPPEPKRQDAAST